MKKQEYGITGFRIRFTSPAFFAASTAMARNLECESEINAIEQIHSKLNLSIRDNTRRDLRGPTIFGHSFITFLGTG